VAPANSIIAIDGPSGTGKSTVARTVAERIGAGYLDTGALYRIVTLHVLKAGIDPGDADAVAAALDGLTFDVPTDPHAQVHHLAGVDVTDRIRDADVTAAVSAVSAIPAVRAFLLDRQREIAHSGRMVIEGRDIGTVIAPDAAVKVFLTADAAVRAGRRYRQDAARSAGGSVRVDPGSAGSDAPGIDAAVDRVAEGLDLRDAIDSSRAAAPLKAADDAVVIDSTNLTAAQTVAAVLALARERGLPGVPGEVATSGAGPARREAGGTQESRMAGGAHAADSAHAATSPASPPVSLPVKWFRLGGLGDPVPVGRRPRDVDRGRRIGIALSHIMYRMRIRGEEHIPVSSPLVVVANHTTFADGPILFGRLPRRISFLIKAEVLVGPLGWLLRTVGQYSIDRAAPQREVLLAALNHLKAGGVIGIFPEGQRTDGSVSEVFHGAGWLAARAGATVVPVALRGTARPAGRRIKRFRPKVYTLVGEPFDIPPGAGRTAINAATSTIQQHLSGLVADLDRGLARVADDRTRFGHRWRRP
jgi:cytidylate kinase